MNKRSQAMIPVAGMVLVLSSCGGARDDAGLFASGTVEATEADSG